MKYEPHSFTRKVLNWNYCTYCGLIALRNERTRQAIRLGCNWKDRLS